MFFDPGSVTAAKITEDAIYEGVRVLQGPLQLPRGVTIRRVIGRQAPPDEYKEAAKALTG